MLARGELHKRRQEPEEPLEQDRAEGGNEQIDARHTAMNNHEALLVLILPLVRYSHRRHNEKLPILVKGRRESANREVMFCYCDAARVGICMFSAGPLLKVEGWDMA